MMSSFIIGQYVPKDSVIHKLDPRAKLIVVFSFVLIIFLADNFISYSTLGMFTLLPLILSKVPLSFIFRGIRPILWVILFTLLLHFLLTKEGEIVFEWGPFVVYEEGFRQGIYISFRILFLILLTTLLTLTTTPIEITDGVESLLSPFKRFGVPAHELALMMSISLRFIPTLMQETEKIMKAQSARGVDFTTGPLKDRVKAIIPLLIPLFISAFKRAEDLAMAMEARGYKGGEGRTKLRELKWNIGDTFAVGFLFLLAGLLAFLRFY
jgi:energy-coupling factor transport system permease protein